MEGVTPAKVELYFASLVANDAVFTLVDSFVLITEATELDVFVEGTLKKVMVNRINKEYEVPLPVNNNWLG